jgi:ElaB/YqjD/DUF883 family membrane-anchored ribosome-binding protein
MTSTTYQNSDENNDAINALKADYDTRLQALRDGSGGTSGFQSAAGRGRKFVKNNPVLVIGGALTVGLLVGAFFGRRSVSGSTNGSRSSGK